MTYNKSIPEKVMNRWIDFSLDAYCINFLEANFNKYIVNLFLSIKEGM